MKASLAGAAATFNALPVQMAQIAEALRAKRAETEGGAPEASSAEAPAAEVPAAEDSAPEDSAPEAGTPDAQAAPGDGDEG
jgi:large subunit ribosomal protein L10